jgi:hypothetical protein
VVVLWDCVPVRGLTALLARAARVAVLFAVVSSTAFAGGRAAPAPVVGATERAEIAGAFGRFFTGALSPTAAGRFVQAGDAPIADALNQAFEGFFMGFTHSQVRVNSVARSTAMVARVRFEVDVAFRGGFDRQLFTGAAVERAGRWKVGWATACFVAETFSVRCPSAPAGAAVLPIPTAPLAAQYTRPSAAGLIRPQELAVAPNGDLLIVDPQRDQVFRRTADGDLRLVAGTGAAGFAGDGGPAVAAEFNDPEGIVAAPDGTIYVADAGNDRVRTIAVDGTINTVVAHLPQPTGLALAADGTLYVADGNAVVTISPSGTVRTFVTGKGTGLQNFDTNARAAATTAAKQLDTDFYGGLRVSDRAWWPGYYTDQIDNSYQTGHHAVIQVRPAASDIYAPAVRRACGAALLDRSLEITIGRSAYSFQISHLYFVDRNGHALLYWQHT